MVSQDLANRMHHDARRERACETRAGHGRARVSALVRFSIARTLLSKTFFNGVFALPPVEL